MAWTDAELARIETIEEILNDVQTSIINLMDKNQMRHLLLIRQREIEDLQTRVAALESQVTTLQNNMD